jgi:hypothetical protein
MMVETDINGVGLMSTDSSPQSIYRLSFKNLELPASFRPATRGNSSLFYDLQNTCGLITLLLPRP